MELWLNTWTTFLCFSGPRLLAVIDDIMIQAESQEIVDEILQALIQCMKEKGREINPAKVQGPAQQVKVLGIHWNQGHEELLPKAIQTILHFPPHCSEKETQKFIGLFGYWRAHILHLGVILQPLYKMTRKKYEFEWGEKEAAT